MFCMQVCVGWVTNNVSCRQMYVACGTHSVCRLCTIEHCTFVIAGGARVPHAKIQVLPQAASNYSLTYWGQLLPSPPNSIRRMSYTTGTFHAQS